MSVLYDPDEQKKRHQQLATLLQMRAMHEIITRVTKTCFELCVPTINPRMEDSEGVCVANCAANFLKMKLLMAQQMAVSIQDQDGQAGTQGGAIARIVQ